MRLNYFNNKPKALEIDVDAYLNRIGMEKQNPSFDYLKKLHLAHLMSVPFENLDIHYRRKIILDYKKIFEKIVTNNRGGFCYEINGLFYHLLSRLGFDCYIISARVRGEDGKYGKDFDHMAIIVQIEEASWLVDVGFGEGIRYPKKIEKNRVQMDYANYWRFIHDPDENLILQVSNDTTVFESKYTFREDEKQIIQFIEMCEFHQTSPNSPFTHRKLITMLTESGRVTLTDRSLKITQFGKLEEIPIMNEDEFLSKLEHHFGISLHQLIPKE